MNLDVKPVAASNQVVKMTMNYLSQTKASTNQQALVSTEEQKSV
jgi:hypothetical protein